VSKKCVYKARGGSFRVEHLLRHTALVAGSLYDCKVAVIIPPEKVKYRGKHFDPSMEGYHLFQFAFLSSEMKLFVSKALVWPFDSKEILRWLDRVLGDSIDASPYTTPVQSRNVTLFGYETALQHHSQFGSDEDLVVVGGPSIPPTSECLP
jgi:hypothetical protein